MTRVFHFKVPRSALKQPNPPLSSDRSSTWSLVKQLGPCDENSRSPPTPHEEAVLATFGKLQDALLEVGDTQLPLPFTYHSSVNGEPNYVTQPRLSVSKLLTSSWCELRTYFDIYAGLPKKAVTTRMQTGTGYHQHLELQDHAIVLWESLQELIRKYLAKFSPEEQDKLMSNSLAAELGSHWADQVVARSLMVADKRRGREIIVHGFLNIHTGQLARTVAELLLAVLVNGIIDVVKIDGKNYQKQLTTSFPDRRGTGDYVEIPDEELHEQKLRALRVIDLTVELSRAKKELDLASNANFLHVRDVKTRASNYIPNQDLVVHGARVQCMYYAQFLNNLSQSAEFAYASCLENAKRRGVAVDEPLGIAQATISIISNFGTLALDMKRLARGEPIGFDEFDNGERSASEEAFSLSDFVTEAEFRDMLSVVYGESSTFLSEDISDLFKRWKQPLTFRYFAARSGQAFNLYEKFEPASVCIEYHNVKTHQIIAYKHFPFRDDVMLKSIAETCSFWSGQRKPQATDDRSKCRHCEFQSRCPAINKSTQVLAGDLIYKLLEG